MQAVQRLGDYGYQAAVKFNQMEPKARQVANVRVTPEDTVSFSKEKGTTHFSDAAILNFLAHTQEDLKSIDGNLSQITGEKANGEISLSELKYHFSGKKNPPKAKLLLRKLDGLIKKESKSDILARHFMKAFDRGDGNGGKPDKILTLDELTAQQIVEVAPDQAFREVIAKERKTLGKSLTAVSQELAQITHDPKEAGISTLRKRAYLASQIEWAHKGTRVEQAADLIMADYNLTQAAKAFVQGQSFLMA